LRRLSVFVGSRTVEAAEQVCGDPQPPTSLDPSEVLDLLARLVDRSLVTADETDERETRYRFLETIRQYARDKLLEGGEAEMLRDRHMWYFERLSKECEPLLVGPKSAIATARLLADEGNILSAVTWAAERDPELALQIAGDLLFFNGPGTYIAAMRPALDAALARLDELPAAEGAAAREREHVCAAGLTALGQVKTVQGDMHGAARTLQRAVAQAREVDDRHLLAAALSDLGAMLGRVGDFAAAEGVIEEAIELSREAGFKAVLAWALGMRGRARAAQRQDYAGAQADFQEALRLGAEARDRRTIGMVQVFLAEVELQEGRYAEAAAEYQEALALGHETREWVIENLARSGLADACRLTGDFAQATALYRQVIRNHQISGNSGGVARCLECLAFMQVQQAEAGLDKSQAEYLQAAARMFGAAEALREASGMPMSVDESEGYAQYVSRLRALMGDRAREAAWAEGRVLTIEQVLEGNHD
jgi:tetratricopeptide (TPR) repeat protein